MTTGCADYRFRIRGVASDLLRIVFDDVVMDEEAGDTVIRTGWMDSAALYGLIGRIESMGLILLEVRVVSGDDKAVGKPEVSEIGDHHMTVNVDELGPVDWIVVEFPGDKLNGEIAPVLSDYVERGLVRVLDLLFMKKDQDGAVEFFETTDLKDDEMGGLRARETELAMLLSEQDVLDVAETIDPGSSAALLVWENLWAAPFGAAVRHSGGHLTASGRIPTQAVLAALQADAQEAEGA